MNFFDLTGKKSVKESILFYFVMLIFGSFLGAIIGFAFSESIGSTNYLENSIKVGTIFSPLYCMLLCFGILRKKGLFTDKNGIIITIFSVLLGTWAGLMFGLIPVAVLYSTAPKGSLEEDNDTEKDSDNVFKNEE